MYYDKFSLQVKTETNLKFETTNIPKANTVRIKTAEDPIENLKLIVSLFIHRD